MLRDVLIKRAGNKGRVKLRHPLRLLVIDTGKRLLNGKPELLVLREERPEWDGTISIAATASMTKAQCPPAHRPAQR